MIFDTSAMSCCSKKSMKIASRSLQKQLSNQQPNLDRFWSQLGPILGGGWGAKLEPSWHKIALKVNPKNDQKNDHHFDGIQIDF